MALNFDKMANEGNQFIKELAGQLGYPEDTSRAGRVLRSILHALRDQLTPEESLQLLAQLPMFLKAVYVENWRSQEKKERIKSLEEFFDKIRSLDQPSAANDFASDDEIDRACSVVLMSLRKYVSLGELEDIKAILSKELKPLLNSVLMI